MSSVVEEQVWAAAFVKELLESDIEYSDVAEFLDDEEAPADIEAAEVYGQARSIIDTILQRWLDSDS